MSTLPHAGQFAQPQEPALIRFPGQPLFEFQVTGRQAGFVRLDVAIPERMVRPFVQLLESMTGFVQLLDRRIQIHQAHERAVDPQRLEEAAQAETDFRDLVLTLFDAFRDQGHAPQKAASLTNRALKARQHPWATLHQVEKTLRAQGRFRKQRQSQACPQGSERSE